MWSATSFATRCLVDDRLVDAAPQWLGAGPAVRARASALPILVASIQPGLEAAALAAGVTAFVPKYRLVEYLPGFLRRFAKEREDGVSSGAA